jgi:hypothetical protein
MYSGVQGVPMETAVNDPFFLNFSKDFMPPVVTVTAS